jgi:hypothetical protein
MLHMLIDHMFHIAMNMFDIIISMINNLFYVIIIMLICGTKMTWKLPIYLTLSPFLFTNILYHKYSFETTHAHLDLRVWYPSEDPSLTRQNMEGKYVVSLNYL